MKIISENVTVTSKAKGERSRLAYLLTPIVGQYEIYIYKADLSLLFHWKPTENIQ